MKRLNGKSGCAVEVTLSVMGGTWKPIVLFHLLRGKKRFGELQRSIGGITQRMLTLQLRELEAAGIVERTVYAEVPPRVDYELTALGHCAAGHARLGLGLSATFAARRQRTQPQPSRRSVTCCGFDSA